MTKTLFLAALQDEVIERYAWASDGSGRRTKFMDLTRQTIEGTNNLVQIDGDAFKAAWKTIGGTGKPTFKALRALPA